MNPVQKTALEEFENKMLEGGFEFSGSRPLAALNDRTAYIVDFREPNGGVEVTRYVLYDGTVV